MQQRVNNLWLSDQLIEAASTTPAEPAATPSDPIADKKNRAALYPPASSGLRRLWQHLAMGLLLLGSAAFSYLAWSESDARGTIARARGIPVEQVYAGDSRKEVPMTFPATALGLDQAAVNTLRVKNRQLQLRIAELEKALSHPVASVQ